MYFVCVCACESCYSEGERQLWRRFCCCGFFVHIKGALNGFFTRASDRFRASHQYPDAYTPKVKWREKTLGPNRAANISSEDEAAVAADQQETQKRRNKNESPPPTHPHPSSLVMTSTSLGWGLSCQFSSSSSSPTSKRVSLMMSVTATSRPLGSGTFHFFFLLCRPRCCCSITHRRIDRQLLTTFVLSRPVNTRPKHFNLAGSCC